MAQNHVVPTLSTMVLIVAILHYKFIIQESETSGFYQFNKTKFLTKVSKVKKKKREN